MTCERDFRMPSAGIGRGSGELRNKMLLCLTLISCCSSRTHDTRQYALEINFIQSVSKIGVDRQRQIQGACQVHQHGTWVGAEAPYHHGVSDE